MVPKVNAEVDWCAIATVLTHMKIITTGTGKMEAVSKAQRTHNLPFICRNRRVDVKPPIKEVRQ